MSQLRLVVTVTDYDEAVRFYRDGLAKEGAYTSDGGGRLVILQAGRG